MTGNLSKTRGVLGSTGPQGPIGPQGVKGDTPTLKFVYDEGTGDLYYTSDGILLDKEYADSNNYATKEFVTQALLDLSNRIAPSPASITLYADRWVQGTGETMWHQEIVVANATVTPNSKVDLQPSPEQLCIFHEKDIAFVAENDEGKVTIFCIGQKPMNDYTIQVTVTEVIVNG